MPFVHVFFSPNPQVSKHLKLIPTGMTTKNTLFSICLCGKNSFIENKAMQEVKS